MSEKEQTRNGSEIDNPETESKKNAKLESLVPMIIGGGTFALLALMTLLMYFANN